MDPAQTASIDLVEAAYDLELGAADWLPNALNAGRQVLDLGMGFVGAWWSGASEDGQPLIVQMHVSEGAEDLPVRFTRAAQASGPELVAQTTQALSGGVNVLSEDRGRWPQVYEAMTSQIGCKDLLGLWAMDPDLYGTSLPIPSPAIIRLTPRARDHWRVLVVHLTAGRRLRRHIDERQVRGVPPRTCPSMQRRCWIRPGSSSRRPPQVRRARRHRPDSRGCHSSRQGEGQASQEQPRRSARDLARPGARPLVAGGLIRHRRAPLRARQAQRSEPR